MPNITKRAFLCGAMALAAAGAFAQGYPDHPVKLVIPYAAGGPTDVLGRTVAEQLSRTLKQSVIVENRPGAAGIVAMTAVSKAAPDGYTLLLGDMNLAVGPALHKSLPFDPVKDFTPIGMVATAPMLMLVPTASPAKSARDYVAYAKSGKLAYASAGIGSPTHLAAEVLKVRYDLDITHVPFQGSAPALTAVAAGQASMIFTGLSGAKPLIDAGRLRPLAITGNERSPVMPQVPTLKEAGVDLPELSVGSWWGVLAPAGVPQGTVDQIRAALDAALAAPELKERLKSLNFSQRPQGIDFGQWVAKEASTWGAVLQKAGIRPD